jgi:hypothetical protein
MSSSGVPAPVPVPKCPECTTQLVLIDNKLPKKCEKCGFLLEGYQGFKRWVKAIEKEEEAERAQKEQERKEKEQKEGGGNFFDSLRDV